MLMIKENQPNPIIIAGPCAAESRQQVVTTANELKHVSAFRACLWKPRTKSGGFEGAGIEGIPWLKQVVQIGQAVATEAMTADQITSLIKGISNGSNDTQIIAWIGARNQNHQIQKEIAQRMLTEGSENDLLMIKNPPWNDMGHWLGIVDHVTSTGFPLKRIILCHRGFHPSLNDPNPHNLRNIPDFDMAMRVKKRTGIPMILDSSHIGGSPENIEKIIQASSQFDFDGHMIEVHPNPPQALTDSQQQLTFKQFNKLNLLK